MNSLKSKRLLLALAAILMFAPAVWAQETKLAEGEILYQGIVRLEKCDEAKVSFVLSAQKDTLKHFSIELNGVYVQKSSSGTLSKISSSDSYSVAVAVKDGIVDYTYPWRGENWRISIKTGLGNDRVKGEFKFIYVVNSNQIEDLGTVPVEFKKVEPKQE
ncbi:MAG: hypothetical protein LBP63_04660 [Prevotellaceae bacterium]|jgi:hypothetical protein|nr:hypothetical protein [Prevotellaceae bacterium]